MENHINIRKVEENDDKSLATLIRRVFEEHDAPRTGTVYSDPVTDHLFGHFQIKGAVLWVAESDIEVVGCCGIYPTSGLPEGCAELVKFYLLQKARGKGIGRALMEKSLQTAKKMGYTKIYIESLPQFSKAVHLYEKQGFTKLSHRMGDSGHASCNIWMVKNLKNK